MECSCRSTPGISDVKAASKNIIVKWNARQDVTTGILPDSLTRDDRGIWPWRTSVAAACRPREWHGQPKATNRRASHGLRARLRNCDAGVARTHRAGVVHKRVDSEDASAAVEEIEVDRGCIQAHVVFKRQHYISRCAIIDD